MSISFLKPWRDRHLEIITYNKLCQAMLKTTLFLEYQKIPNRDYEQLCLNIFEQLEEESSCIGEDL